MEPRKYGLVQLNSKKDNQKVPLKGLGKASSFFDQSDSDDDDGDSGFVMPVGNTLKRQDKAQISQAIEEDPSVYQYDEIYDEIKGVDKKNDAKKAVQNKPKYITNMLKTAERRTKEQELVSERKIQRERERERDLYKDKDVFVTSSYRNKMEEMKKAQAEEERQERIETMLDVTKQADLGGFYRNLYKHNMAHVKETEEPDKEKSETVISFNKKSQQAQKRQFRVYDSDKNAEDDEESVVIKRTRDPEPEANLEKNTKENSIAENDNSEAITLQNVDQKEDINDEKDKENHIIKEKRDRMTVIKELFQKRTIGEVFEEAQKRYLLRKASKLS